MNIKEKLRLLADIRKRNEQRLKAWIEERKAAHDGIQDRQGDCPNARNARPEEP